MNEILGALLGSFAGLAALLTAIWNIILTKKTKNDAETAALRELMYDSIESKCKTALLRGYVTADELESICRKHKIYHDGLKGNGYLDTLMAKVKSLPIVDGKEK